MHQLYIYTYTHTHIDAFVCNWCTPNPTYYMGQPHTHTHRETEGRQRSSFLMLLSFVLLLFYSWPCFNSQRLCLWRVILLLARGEGEREREWSTCSSCSRPLATSPATLSQSHSQSQSVCRIASHGIASCSSVFTHGHGYTQLTTYTHTRILRHIWVVRVCACK